MSLAFAETDDYAEIVDEEDTYTMPSSKSPDCLFFGAGELCELKGKVEASLSARRLPAFGRLTQ